MFSDEAKLVVKNFPLKKHKFARKAAQAALAAKVQGKFWEYHDVLFMNQNALGINNLKEYASDLGLNTGQFNGCLDSEKYAEKVNKDIEDAMSYGVSGTPAFFINGQMLSGSQPFSEFEPLLNL